MHRFTQLHLDHTQALFLSERSCRESVWDSLSMPVAAISFAVFAFTSLSDAINPEGWRQLPTFLILVLSTAPVIALLASAWQVLLAEWLFVNHEPPALPSFSVMRRPCLMRGIKESAIGPCLPSATPSSLTSIRRATQLVHAAETWALRCMLLSLLLQALTFVLLAFLRAGWG